MGNAMLIDLLTGGADKIDYGLGRLSDRKGEFHPNEGTPEEVKK